MKKSHHISKFSIVLFLSACILFFGGCVEDRSISTGFMSFSFQNQSANGGRVEDATDAAFIVVSMLDSEGSAFFQSEEINLYNFSGKMITESISLPIGQYTLTEYNILDASMNVIYAIPLAASNLGYLVENPLPFTIDVTKNTTTKVSPEVISTDGQAPEDFGYTSLELNIAPVVGFLATIFVFDTDPLVLDWILTTADMTITSGIETLYSGTLDPATNHIQVDGDYTSYDVTIAKTGLTTQTATYTKSELQAFFNSPMTIFLN